MPRRRCRPRFRPLRSRARLERFLQRCCFICLNSPSEYPSKRLPCCFQFIHEECLLTSFQYSSRTNLHDTCPHFRNFISSYNHSDDIPHGSYPFRFDFFSYPPPSAPPPRPPPPPSHDDYLDYFGILQDNAFLSPADSDRLFLDPPAPSPPAGWAEFRRTHY